MIGQTPLEAWQVHDMNSYINRDKYSRDSSSGDHRDGPMQSIQHFLF